MQAVCVSSCCIAEWCSSDHKLLPLVSLQGSSLSKLLNAIKWFRCGREKSAPRKR